MSRFVIPALCCLLLAGCFTWPNRRISVRDMEQLLRLDDAMKETTKLRKDSKWTSVSSIKPKTVLFFWKKIQKSVNVLLNFKSKNKHVKRKLKAYLSSYYYELEYRVDVLSSSQKYALAKAAASGLPRKSKKRLHAYRILSEQLEKQANAKKNRYPGLAIYYLHAAGVMVSDGNHSKGKQLQAEALRIAKTFRYKYALPVQLDVSGSLSSQVQSKIRGLLQRRTDTKLRGGGIRLSISSQSPSFRRSTRRNSLSKRYKSGTKMVANPRYNSAKSSVEMGRWKVNNSRSACNRFGGRNVTCQALGSSRRYLQSAEATLANTPRQARVDVYSDYRYTTTTSFLKTRSQVQAVVKPRRGRGLRQSQNVLSTLSQTGHASHPTIHLSYKAKRPPTQGAGESDLAKNIASFVSNRAVSVHLANVGALIVQRTHSKGSTEGIDACASFLLRYPTARTKHLNLIWKRLHELTSLAHRKLP